MSKKSAEVDEHMVENLILYADNESALYNQKKSIEQNLSKKICDGKFDLKLSAKLWRYWFDNAAKHHDRAFGGHVGTAERQAAAEQMAQHFASNWSYDEVIPANNDGEAWRLVRSGVGSEWVATLPDRLGGESIVQRFSPKTAQRAILKSLKQLSRKILKAWTHSEKIYDKFDAAMKSLQKKHSKGNVDRVIKLFRQLPKAMKDKNEERMHLATSKPMNVEGGKRGSGVEVLDWAPVSNPAGVEKLRSLLLALQAGGVSAELTSRRFFDRSLRKHTTHYEIKVRQPDLARAKQIWSNLKGGSPAGGESGPAMGGNSHLIFQRGSRVELKPHLDRWMMGDRFGDVVSAAKGIVKVKLDKSGKTLKFKGDDLTLLNPSGRAMFTSAELHQRLVDAGAELDHHESDLYVKVDPTSTQILERYVYKNQVKSFVSPIDKQRWYDVPFAYNPKLGGINEVPRTAPKFSIRQRVRFVEPGGPDYGSGTVLEIGKSQATGAPQYQVLFADGARWILEKDLAGEG